MCIGEHEHQGASRRARQTTETSLSSFASTSCASNVRLDYYAGLRISLTFKTRVVATRTESFSLSLRRSLNPSPVSHPSGNEPLQIHPPHSQNETLQEHYFCGQSESCATLHTRAHTVCQYEERDAWASKKFPTDSPAVQ